MKRILVVDDEEMIVRTVKAYLDQDGFKTYTAYDGEEALRAFEEKGPDLIVLDLMLPKLSGIEVTKRIRASSNVPIIMLTAKASEADRVVGLELGAVKAAPIVCQPDHEHRSPRRPLRSRRRLPQRQPTHDFQTHSQFFGL